MSINQINIYECFHELTMRNFNRNMRFLIGFLSYFSDLTNIFKDSEFSLNEKINQISRIIYKIEVN